MDGIILINKEKGYTSNDIVCIVRKIVNEKVGHTGTLDPDATGVLPLLIGKGTKLSKYLIEHDKIYKAVLKLGIKTDTADISGNIIKEDEVNKNIINKENVDKALKSVIGKQEQIPPMYSAIKVNGKKLYEYARRGEKIKVNARNIEIYNIELNDINTLDNEITFTVKCSKGTYIRTLCEQIAEKIGTIGCMKDLERIEVGKFNINNSVTISKLKENKELINKYIISFEEILQDKEIICIDSSEIEKFLNGVKLNKNLKDGIYRIYNEKNIFMGTGEIKNNTLKRDIILM